MGHEERANEAALKREREIEQAALQLANHAKLRLQDKYIGPMIAEWRKKPLDDLLGFAEVMETEAYNLAAAGLPHALTVGWDVRETAAVCRGAHLQAIATVNSFSKEESGYAGAVENLARVEQGAILALSRAFAAVNMVMVVHKQLTEAVAAREALAEAQPAHDTEAVAS